MSLYKYLVHLYYQIIIYFGINYLFSKKITQTKILTLKFLNKLTKHGEELFTHLMESFKHPLLSFVQLEHL